MTKRNIIKWLVRATAISLWVVLLAAYFLFQPETTMFMPSGYSRSEYATLEQIPTAKELTIYRDEHPINAWYCKVAKSKYIVLFSHGNGHNVGFVGWKIKTLTELGVSVFAYDYEGYGKSPGKPTIQTLISDAETAYRYVSQKLNYKPNQIIMYGESVGAGVNAQLMQHDTVSAAIFDGTFSSLPDIIKDSYPIVPYIYPNFPSNKLETSKIIRDIKVPMLFIHAEHDTIIPWAHAKRLYDSAAGPKIFELLPHSDHAVIEDSDKEKYRQTIKRFLASIA